MTLNIDFIEAIYVGKDFKVANVKDHLILQFPYLSTLLKKAFLRAEQLQQLGAYA